VTGFAAFTRPAALQFFLILLLTSDSGHSVVPSLVLWAPSIYYNYGRCLIYWSEISTGNQTKKQRDRPGEAVEPVTNLSGRAFD